MQRALADPALGPVEPPLHPRGGAQRHQMDVIERDALVQLLLQPHHAAIRPPDPADRVEIGQVVIARLDQDGPTQIGEPGLRGGEFGRACAHRQIAGDDDNLGLLVGDDLLEPGERGAVLGAEMQVAGVEQQRHGAAGARVSMKLCGA